jgi:hypothetical protein
MKKIWFLFSTLFLAALTQADPIDVIPAPAQSVVIQDPLPLPVQVEQFPEVQDVNIVSPDPVPVDIGSFPAVQDVRIVNTDPLSVHVESDGLINSIYIRSVRASSGFAAEELTIPFDSRLEGVLIATSGSTQLGNCRTTLAYKSFSDPHDGSNTDKIVDVLSSTSSEVGSSSIHVPIPGLFIPGSTTLTASISDAGPFPDNTCSSDLILYLRDQRPQIGG